jgi:hypothetical protein
MDLGAAGTFRDEDVFLLFVTIAVVAGMVLVGIAACFYWFRREQNRHQKEILNALAASERDPDALFLTGRDAAIHGELVAQFKVNRGKQVVSLLESDGKRFLHVDGKLSAPERAKMVRYLKSEGFMT